MDKKASYLLKDGLIIIPIDRIAVTNTYQSSGSTLSESEPWNYKVVIGDFETSRELASSYTRGDNKAIGRLLGYPECCVDFFNEVWIDQKWLDTSYFMGSSGSHYPYCNILLRWLGLRFVSHLPCSFDCERTKTIGKLNHELAYRMGRRTASDLLYDILSWPVEWSGLHGIGVITTPVCKVAVRTDMWNEKKVVQIKGDRYPKEGASGIVFPFSGRNGFSNVDAEQKAHNLILDLLRCCLPPKSAIDFGCGDGVLLKKINTEFGARIFGVDDNPENKPDLVSNIFALTDFPEFDLALISKMRLGENPTGWSKLLEIIQRRCKYLLLYSYNKDETIAAIDGFKLATGMTDQQTIAHLYVKTEIA